MYSNERMITTDMLVIGGGMAGMFAAIKARERGLDVTMVDKAYVGKSASTHFSEGDILYFRPEKGHKLKEWVDIISQRCEYLNNKEWDEICLTESEDRYNDLVSWGVPFMEKDGDTFIFTMMNRPSAYKDITMVHKKFAPTLRQKALEIGVRVIDRIMICELIKQDGQIAGAIGFHTNSGNLYIFKTNAVIIATGNSSLKSGSYPVYTWTGDGDAMAFRAGAQISGKEFSYGSAGFDRQTQNMSPQKGQAFKISGEIREQNYNYPFAIGGNWTGWYDRPSINSDGGPVTIPAWEAHEGRIPIYFDFDGMPPAPRAWLDIFFKRIGTYQQEKIGLDPEIGGKVKWPASRIRSYSIHGGASGVWPIDKTCVSDVPGLYAAGNSCATMASATSYGGGGFGSNHAMVTGTRAGLYAAEYVSKLKEISFDRAELKKAKEKVCAPITRLGGFSPDWVTQTLHGYMLPYFVLNIKHEERLKPALSQVKFISSHIVPKIKANNPHEWRQAQETKNIVLIAEMMLEASLFRKESRGVHYREDHPRRDDSTWLAWVKIKNVDGIMKLYKESVPKRWWPDLNESYEKRYPNALPLE